MPNNLPIIDTKFRKSKALPRYFSEKSSVHRVLPVTKVMPIPNPKTNKLPKKKSKCAVKIRNELEIDSNNKPIMRDCLRPA